MTAMTLPLFGWLFIIWCLKSLIQLWLLKKKRHQGKYTFIDLMHMSVIVLADAPFSAVHGKVSLSSQGWNIVPPKVRILKGSCRTLGFLTRLPLGQVWPLQLPAGASLVLARGCSGQVTESDGKLDLNIFFASHLYRAEFFSHIYFPFNIHGLMNVHLNGKSN